MPETSRKIDRALLIKGISSLAVLAILALAWRATPLKHCIDFATLMAWTESVKADPGAPYVIVAAYALGALAFFPVPLMTLAAVFVFGPAIGGAYSVMGSLLAAAAGYGAGRALHRDLLRSLAGPRIDRLDREAGRNGLVAVLLMRLLPVAPFTLVNCFVGASRIRFRDLIFGTLLGKAPGLLALLLFEYRIDGALSAPAPGKIALIAAMLATISLVSAWLARQYAFATREDGG